MLFKTNARCSGCIDKISQAVKNIFPDAQLQFDLESTDKILKVHGIPENNQNASRIEAAIQETGFKGAWLTRDLENK